MLQRLYVLMSLDGRWVPCGVLEHHDDGRRSSSLFRYGRKYLQRPDALAVDPIQLPLEDRSFETPEGFALFNGIRDAGPDRWGRYLLDKKFARTLSEIEYVAATSEDRAGALAFADSPQSNPQHYAPPGTFQKQRKAVRLDLNQCALAVDDLVASEETERLRQYLDYGPSLGGARPKTNVMWGKNLSLAKFSLSLDSKNEPLIEYATMTLAQKCGLNVPALGLERLDGRSVFLIRRFDRQGIHVLPFVSGLTLTGVHESDYGAWSYLSLADAVIRFSENPQKDLWELFKRMVFNIAVYNNDDHPRNFGFLASGKHWNLAPLYDVVPGVTHTNTYAQAMTVGLEGRLSSFKNALSLCERFRIDMTQASHIVEEVRDITAGWKKHFSDFGATGAEVAMLENSFRIKS